MKTGRQPLLPSTLKTSARTSAPVLASHPLLAAFVLAAVLAFACMLGGSTAWAAQGVDAGAGLTAGLISTQANEISGLDLVEEPDPGDNHYDSPDGKVVVSSYKSGSASYDEQTSTLTITDLHAALNTEDTVTLVLNGSNQLDWLTASAGINGTLIVKGSGSLTLADGYLSAYGYEQHGGTVNSSDMLQIEANALVSGGTIHAGSISASNYTQKGGTVALTDSLDADNAVTISGGTLSAPQLGLDSYLQSGGKVTLKNDLTSNGNVTVSGGALTTRTISCEDSLCKISNGNVTVSEVLESSSFVMSGGKLAGCEINGFKGIEISGGSITCSNNPSGIYSRGNIVIKGGSISSTGGDAGVTAKGTVTVSDGTITLKSCTGGIEAGKAFVMTGGTVTITKSDSPIVAGKVYSGTRKPKSGTVKILGGSLTAKATLPGYEAILTKNFSYKEGCIKAIYGAMPDGFKFTYKKNKYMIRNGNVTLLKYNSSVRKAELEYAKFGGNKYGITGVASSAFDTKAGHKVKSLFFFYDIEFLDNNAFAKTSSLVSLCIAFPNNVVKLNSNGFVTKVNAKKGSYAKKAFANCGKNKGKGLELAVNNVSAKYDKKGLNQVKKMLHSHGLSKKVKVV